MASGQPSLRLFTKQMVLDTANLSVETTVESQLSSMVSEGDF